MPRAVAYVCLLRRQRSHRATAASLPLPWPEIAMAAADAARSVVPYYIITAAAFFPDF